MNIDIKPCPFCGGEAKVKSYSNGFNIWFRVRCDDCGVAQDGIRNGYYDEESAVEAWNRRVKNEMDASHHCKLIDKIPAIQPEQKTATFYVDSEGYERCSACNEYESGMRYFNFCPNCGAKMEADENDH